MFSPVGLREHDPMYGMPAELGPRGSPALMGAVDYCAWHQSACATWIKLTNSEALTQNAYFF